ncbi:hypothetical protein FRB99_008212, partial [Tulasnella sp. 403]
MALWKISKTRDEALKLTAADFEGEKRTSPRLIVGEYWTNLTAEVHVFIANPL